MPLLLVSLILKAVFSDGNVCPLASGECAEVDLGGGEFCIFGNMLSGLPCVMNLANAGDVAIESSSPRLLLGLGIVVLIGGNLGGGLRSNFFSSFNAGLGGSVTAVLGRESCAVCSYSTLPSLSSCCGLSGLSGMSISRTV